MPYKTPEQASAVARNIGCKGVHRKDGMFYPCKTEAEYNRLKKRPSYKVKDDPKTPAKPSERRRGSTRNKPGSAGSASGKITLSPANIKTLENKVAEHNKKHGDTPSKRATLGQLKAVFRRGAGAYSTSHRPSVTSRTQWAVARVNAFLRLLATGKPKNPKYVTDNDLLPKGHPRSTKKSLEIELEKAKTVKVPAPEGHHWMVYDIDGVKLMANPPDGFVPHDKATEVLEVELIETHMQKEESFTVPQNVRSAARRGLRLREKFGRGGLTPQEAGKQGIGSGMARARDLVEGKVSYSTVKRMKAFFSRHRGNKKTGPDSRGRMWDSDSNPTNGFIAHLLWGGDAGKRWAESVVRREEAKKAAGSKRGGPQIRLYDITNSVVRNMQDHDLRMMWKRLKQWYAMGNTKGEKRLGMLKAARLILREMVRRKFPISGGDQMARLVGKSEILFVVAEPTPLEKARREFLVGPDGVVFKNCYLDPMGVVKSDVDILDIEQYADIYPDKKNDHTITIALGRVAKEYLGDKANFTLPHPAALRRHGDSGEVGRKIKSMFKYMEEQENAGVEVAISKMDHKKKIVYSAVLSPDEEDAHGDMVPVGEIEDTAHKYLEKSRAVGRQHTSLANAKVVESYVVHYPSDEDYKKALAGEDHNSFKIPFGKDHITSGTWVMGVRLGDEEYKAVMDGSITGFSIGGYGHRVERQRSELPNITYHTMQVPRPSLLADRLEGEPTATVDTPYNRGPEGGNSFAPPTRS